MSDDGGGPGGLGVVRDHGFVYEAKAAHKSFAGVEVFSGVAVTFLPGEPHSPLGANGAGESTLLKILAVTDTTGEGQLVMEETTVPPLTCAKALDYGIYVAPKETEVPPDLSVAENTDLGTLPGTTAAVRRTAVNEGAATAPGIVGVHADPRRPAGPSPLALQHLVECARSLFHRCGVVFFDEPTPPRPTMESDALLGLISTLRDRNLTIGFISHRSNEDATFGVRQGEIVGLVGFAGSGRAEAVFGLRTITSGSIELEGTPVMGAMPGDCIGHGLVCPPERRGVDVFGGQGRMNDVVIAVLVLGLLTQGLLNLEVSMLAETMRRGVLLIAALLVKSIAEGTGLRGLADKLIN